MSSESIWKYLFVTLKGTCRWMATLTVRDDVILSAETFAAEGLFSVPPVGDSVNFH